MENETSLCCMHPTHFYLFRIGGTEFNELEFIVMLIPVSMQEIECKIDYVLQSEGLEWEICVECIYRDHLTLRHLLHPYHRHHRPVFVIDDHQSKMDSQIAFYRPGA